MGRNFEPAARKVIGVLAVMRPHAADLEPGHLFSLNRASEGFQRILILRDLTRDKFAISWR